MSAMVELTDRELDAVSGGARAGAGAGGLVAVAAALAVDNIEIIRDVTIGDILSNNDVDVNVDISNVAVAVLGVAQA